MNKRRQTITYIVCDFLASALAWLLFNMFRYHEVAQYVYSTQADFLLKDTVLKGQALIPFFWLTLCFLSGYYYRPFIKSRIAEFFTTFVTVAVGATLIFFVVVLNELPRSFHIYYHLFFVLCVLQFVLMYAGRFAITTRTIHKFARREWQENVLIIGSGDNAIRLRDNLAERGYSIVGIVDPSDSIAQSNAIAKNSLPDSIAQSNAIGKPQNLHALYLAVPPGDEARLLYSIYHYNLPIKVMATEKNNLLSRAKVNNIRDVPTIDVTENNFSDMERSIKWFIDKFISALVLILLSPLFMYIALKVKRSSKGPVFFRQERIGYRGKPFTICKFRTMYTDRPDEGPLLTARDDKRVTPFGKFLRKYRLDEIPQFWNVLKGDMSLVGPRPEQKYYIDLIVKKAPYYYLLHNVRPGITSLGMVRFGYAETVDKMIERLHYDILYYENMSLLFDLKILFYTVKIVFTGKGV
jgi:exopolysaccharide biosynthesis polyprenyl glycosylphosphotransferase